MNNAPTDTFWTTPRQFVRYTPPPLDFLALWINSFRHFFRITFTVR